VALPLLVYDLTGSLAIMSLLAAVVPASLLLGPWLGVVVDRWGPRVMVLPGLALQIAAALALNLAGLSEGAPVGLLFVLAVLIQLGGVLYQTGWMAGVPTMFPAAPARARGSLSTLFVATRIVGVVLFAAGLPALGYAGLLWLNLLTFIAPIVVWWMGIHPPQPVSVPSAPGNRRMLNDFRAGGRILWANRLVVDITVIGLPVLFVTSVGTTTLVIFQLRDGWHLGPSEVATVLTASRIGGLLGTLVVSQRRPLRRRSSFAAVTFGIAAALLALATPWLAVVIVGLAVMSLLQGALVVSAQMIVFKQLPASAIGRVTGLLDLVEGTPMLLAPLLIPLLSAVIGVRATFTVLAVVAVSALPWLVRSGSNRRRSGRQDVG
jgi:MFS family permease